ncbi:MAG: phosphoserine phosphatase SerB [Xanthobacteraceae bacterium]
MTHVATLVCNPAAPLLDDTILARARAALPLAGAPLWLAPSVAADIPFTAADAPADRTLAERVRAALAGLPIDVVVQKAVGRRKKLLLADMDSTMIGEECIDELADLVGLKTHVAAITERAMRGELAFAPALRERVALLKGLHSDVVDEVIAGRLHLTPGGRVLIATMRANGAHTCLVSGGFTMFTQRIAAMIGFDEARANSLVLAADGTFVGEVVEPIFGRDEKLAALIELRRRFGLTPEQTLAAGDGANDLAMIEAAGLGVAYHAKPAVAAAAHARIDHADLTALLYLQGYGREEFVEQQPA